MSSQASNDEKKRQREEKKRQREAKLREYGVELPDIPGLPVELIPIHVHCVKVTAKIFGKTGPFHRRKLDLRSDAAPAHNSSPSNENSVLDSILQRVEATSSETLTIEQRNQQTKLLNEYQESIHSWLNAIKRCLKDNRSKMQREDGELSARKIYSVPVAVLQHLWEVGLDHKRWSIRRATLCMAAKLLEKSADCRSWWLQNEADERDGKSVTSAGKRRDKLSLVQWMDTVLETGPGPISEATILWQQEAYALLLNLQAKGYGQLYPTLDVAIQRFQQQCSPSILKMESMQESTNRSLENSNMSSFRILRDNAMEHWDSTNIRLQKILKKARKCFEIIVPRITENDCKSESNEVDDDDDVEIEWEDGFDEESELIVFDADHETPNHASAVERTLELMQNTGTLREEGLDISIFQPASDAPATFSSDSSIDEIKIKKAKEVALRILTTLATTFMPKLSSWVEALTVSDDLKLKSSPDDVGDSKRLIQLSEEELGHRRSVLASCLIAKEDMAHILNSGRRVGLTASSRDSNSEASQPDFLSKNPFRAPLIFDSIGAKQNQRLATKLTDRKRLLVSRADRTNKRSARVQIKFAKR